MKSTETIEFTIPAFKEFKKLYNEALKEEKEMFIFEEKEVLTSYGKYVIMYLEPKFKENV